jgi:hypothetical protein
MGSSYYEFSPKTKSPTPAPMPNAESTLLPDRPHCPEKLHPDVVEYQPSATSSPYMQQEHPSISHRYSRGRRYYAWQRLMYHWQFQPVDERYTRTLKDQVRLLKHLVSIGAVFEEANDWWLGMRVRMRECLWKEVRFSRKGHDFDRYHGSEVVWMERRYAPERESWVHD